MNTAPAFVAVVSDDLKKFRQNWQSQVYDMIHQFNDVISEFEGVDGFDRFVFNCCCCGKIGFLPDGLTHVRMKLTAPIYVSHKSLMSILSSYTCF